MITFTLDKDEAAKLAAWEKKEHLHCQYKIYAGAVGGAMTYSFSPTSLGVVAKVRCECGKEIDLTDYSSW